MLRFSLLFLFLFVSPHAANGDLQDVVCLGDGNRTAVDNSNHDANVCQLAAMLQSNTSFSPGLSMDHVVGQFPERLHAVSHCHNGTSISSCRGCITLALQEMRQACPDHKDAQFFNSNCSLQLYGDGDFVYSSLISPLEDVLQKSSKCFKKLNLVQTSVILQGSIVVYSSTAAQAQGP